MNYLQDIDRCDITCHAVAANDLAGIHDRLRCCQGHEIACLTNDE